MQPELTPNRLAQESSHYLLQHAQNPVDWHPWTEEAFARAKFEDKPIFLSIGYSTCHWCHVMAHESFENPAVAVLMNEHLICIKVDREERPDIDQLYMSACHAMGRRGGWPLTVLMGHDGRPFFITTYIPRESAFGRMGMLELVPRVAAIWQEQRKDVLATGLQIEDALRANQDQECTPAEPDVPQAADNAYAAFVQRYDAEHGGFGPAPKFPAPHNLLFLLKYARERNEPKALEMVETTLRKMRLGGLFDHVGFGFHRYSTDERWLLPHFEKMLYDQAMLIMAYTEAWESSENPLYRRTTAEIVTYALDQLALPHGAFASGQDADSEGEEGKFYVWTRDEILSALGPEDGQWVCRMFQIENEGNFADEATGQRTGANILHLTETMHNQADLERWAVLRGRLAAVRAQRPKPLTDDGVLADWNGLLIAALARAGSVFEDEGWLETARGVADFVLKSMRGDQGRILHRFRRVPAGQAQGAPTDRIEGHLSGQGFLDDQAFVVWGLLELYSVDHNPRYLQAAEEITHFQLEQFADPDKGGFYLTAADAEALFFRTKEAAEGALPSGNAVTAGNLIRLAELTGNQIYTTAAQNTARAFGQLINSQPLGCTHWLRVLPPEI